MIEISTLGSLNDYQKDIDDKSLTFISEGSFGKVYKAKLTQISALPWNKEEPVAIKLIETYEYAIL